MFCHKCGTQLVDGATFCQKCGAKVLDSQPTSAPGSQVNTPTSATVDPPKPVQPVSQPTQPVQPAQSHQWAGQLKQPYDVQEPAAKKKSKKKFLILGAAALAVIAVVLVVVLNLGGGTDYISTIQQKAPFENDAEITITYGEVFTKYIPDQKWKIDERDDGADVEITGTLSGTELPILVEIEVKLDPENRNRCAITLVSMNIGEKQYSQSDARAMMYAIFKQYEYGTANFAGMEDQLAGVINVETELTETYIDEDMGISFKYPADWTPTKTGAVIESVEMIHNGNNEEHRAVIRFSPDTVDTMGALDGNEETQNWWLELNEATFQSMEDTKVSGFPGKKVTCTMDDVLSNKETISSYYYYQAGEIVGMVEFSCTEDTLDTYAPVFEKILASYTVTVPEPAPTPEPTPSPTPVPTPTPEPVTIIDEVEATYYMEDDNYCEIHLNPLNSYSFDMKVNLYAGIGSCSGVYTVTAEGYHCQIVGEHFRGFLGQDVYEFDLVKTGGGLQYKGEIMGTIHDGVMFYE